MYARVTRTAGPLATIEAATSWFRETVLPRAR